MSRPSPPRRSPILGFVHINKTAGTTLKFILRNSSFFGHCDVLPLMPGHEFTVEDFRFMERVFFSRTRSIAGHPLRHPTDRLPAHVAYFTFVREPGIRCLSHYEMRRRRYQLNGKGDLTFEEFLEDPEMRNRQVRMIAGGPDIEKAKHELSTRYLFAGLTERFDESIRILQYLSPVPLRIRYRRRQVTTDTTARQRLLEEPTAVELLAEHNALDQQLYEFVRDELYPKYRNRAAESGALASDADPGHRGYPLRFRTTRSYNLAVYAPLTKLRRRLDAL